ncbi:hypothetical protein BV25DRAFT_1822648 [Artomyces pyxidatus]|uniref:Uncharacterized protein n=1 Tax=Artomyces pyxidatus TaxID=48021 RepID=A0ACB8TA14_9AGAM|nr:hypothetical protein BV25DRAFT_1822648 [Artomyces pyxidatus]
MATIQSAANRELDSDEDDQDYVPPNVEDASDDSDDERESKRPRKSTTPPPLTEEDVEAQERARQALWAEFQTSVAKPLDRVDQQPKKMIKIEKRYRFAGEEVIEVKEVEADSQEAKNWPAWHPPAQEGSASPSTVPNPPAASTSTTAEASSSASVTSNANPPPATKRPGRRKPKVQLADLPSAKAKKISTLEKSALDWEAHVASQKESKDELEANRRSGGYLEKVQFLQRVGDRKEQALEANADKKRRRT